jgi:hypothetical protein
MTSAVTTSAVEAKAVGTRVFIMQASFARTEWRSAPVALQHLHPPKAKATRNIYLTLQRTHTATHNGHSAARSSFLRKGVVYGLYGAYWAGATWCRAVHRAGTGENEVTCLRLLVLYLTPTYDINRDLT